MGLSGLILAGAFAAAISSLDSILAALSQTSLSVIYGQERMEEEGQGKRMVKISRIAVVIWGVVLTLAGLLLWAIYQSNEDSDLIGLAFGMVAYTYGHVARGSASGVDPLEGERKRPSGGNSFFGVVSGIFSSGTDDHPRS